MTDTSTDSTILFVAQTGQLSGAEKVLLNLVDEASAQGFTAIVACPAGPLADALLARDGVALNLAGHLRAEEWNGKVSAGFFISDAAVA